MEAANSAATEADQPAPKKESATPPPAAKKAPVAPKPAAVAQTTASSSKDESTDLPPDIQEKLQFDQDKKSAIDEGYTED